MPATKIGTDNNLLRKLLSVPFWEKENAMNVLTFNCGSSSLKYRLYGMPEEIELAGGEAQRVGPKTTEPARIIHRVKGRSEEVVFVEMRNHNEAFEQVMKLLAREKELQPQVAGHRLVHGGERLQNVTVMNPQMIAALPELNALAPIHNPPIVALIQACQARYPALPQVGVSDTAFHATIPPRARTYALPRALSEELGLHKYGFHGISHQYVVTEAAKFLKLPLDKFNAVSCHLGSGGASLCAVSGGKSVDNTFGYSPLQGLVMSTRCGDLDPAVTLQLLARANGESAAVENLLNRKSGVLGLSGLSADIRDVLGGADGGSKQLNTAAQIYLWRMRKYLGAYLAVVGNADAVIFTDTIGELVPRVRAAVCANLECFGLKIDENLNNHVTKYPADIAAAGSAARILVILTNEELSIARSTYAALAA